MRLRCPHCNSMGTIRTSEALSATVARHYVMCCNFECGHTWRATTEADMTISPSATPAPLVHLPLSTHVRTDLISEQMRSTQRAEHIPRLTPPITPDLFAPAGPS